ncbi:MAG: GreA/GreB family elongation factor [Pseudomonadota bacterium]|nr:GreA/GreB family elongation factor [Pseudomonadota bacterium]
MSRAFVKEMEHEAAVPVPALSLPPGVPNRITPAGAARLRAELDALQAERSRLRTDDRAEARSRASAIAPRIALLEARAGTWVETPCAPHPDRVVFGSTVTLADLDGKTRRWQIVGVDEAEPTAGRLSFLAPIAQAALGAEVGDVVRVRAPRGEEELEVLEIVGC